ncbi:hypothetical protein DLH72_04140 [Candidatus Gracilibacteria bacterium]|nr:MAG: hypothetical protein DLH72_04140 [Candidatus Gracilibacteria bacterium]
MKNFFRQNIITLTKTGLFIILLGFGIFFKSIPFIIIAGSLGLLSIFEKYLRIKIPSSFSFVFVLFVILSLVLGSYGNFYEKYLWWDDMLHFSYGVGFAIIGYLIIYFILFKKGIENNIFIIVAFSFCFSVAFGAIWEIFEYSMDIFFGMNMQRTIPDLGLDSVTKEILAKNYGVNDTMHDIILESLAAFVTNIYIYLYLKSEKENWIGKITEKFLKANKKD